MKLLTKLTATILTILILMLSLSACSKEDVDSFLDEITLGVWSRILLDEEVHNIIKYNEDDTIEYQGNTYYRAPMIFIQDNSNTVEEKRGYEYIGWCGPRFFYNDVYYGDSKDAPNILYSTSLHYTYFREDYNYKTDIFKLEGTEDVICFGEDLMETSLEPSNWWAGEPILLSSSTHPSLDIHLYIIFENGIWYAQSSDLVYFEVSENFVEILVKNQIIQTD